MTHPATANSHSPGTAQLPHHTTLLKNMIFPHAFIVVPVFVLRQQQHFNIPKMGIEHISHHLSVSYSDIVFP